MTQEVLKLKEDIIVFLKTNDDADLFQRKFLNYKRQDEINKYDSEG